jgi:limonene-1,2-epoxide hydrolase
MTRLFLTLLAACLFMAACDNKPKENTDATTNGTAKEDPVAKALAIDDKMDNAFANANWDEFAAGLAPDAVDHPAGMPEIHGRDSIMTTVKMWTAEVKNMKYKTLNRATDGEYVFKHYRATGTMQPNAMGMKMKGGDFDYTGTEIVRLKDGLCAEHWDYGDNATFMKQVGMDMSAMMPPADKKKK